MKTDDQPMNIFSHAECIGDDYSMNPLQTDRADSSESVMRKTVILDMVSEEGLLTSIENDVSKDRNSTVD